MFNFIEEIQTILAERYNLKLSDWRKMLYHSAAEAAKAELEMKSGFHTVFGGHRVNKNVPKEEVEHIMKKLFKKPTFPRGYQKYSSWEYWFQLNKQIIIIVRDYKTTQTDAWRVDYISSASKQSLANLTASQMYDLLISRIRK